MRWKLNIWLLWRHLYTISVTWPHCGTVHDFFGSFNWPRLPSWVGFFTTRWQWQHVWAARARSSKQNTRANIRMFCLQIWPSIKSRAINCFNKCVFDFYSHWKVWYKSEKAFGMCSEWHYTTRGLAYGDWDKFAAIFQIIFCKSSVHWLRCIYFTLTFLSSIMLKPLLFKNALIYLYLKCPGHSRMSLS